jgi:hypothetical protein
MIDRESSMPHIRVLAGLIAVAIAAVLASADSLQIASQLQSDPYGAQSAVQRLATAAARLPPSGTVGYISDLPVLTQDGMTGYLAAQYALAPRLLAPVERTSPQQAVGNFSRPTDYARAGAKAGYAVEADLGNGVVLYRKVSYTKAK